jgi:hypothetical protein
MIGIITYLGSSPRRILAALAISAAAVAAAQFSPLLQRSSGPADVGAESVTEMIVENSRVAQIFESRPIPVRVPDAVANPGDSEAPGLGQAQEPPITIEEDQPAEIAVNIVLTDDDGAEVVERLVLRPTAAWVNVFGESSTLNGEPLQPGDIVTAFDPDGMLIGRAVVEYEGRYGLMAMYMDDPATSVDEGAESGDVITFKVNGIPAVALGPHAPVWTDNGAIIICNVAAAG